MAAPEAGAASGALAFDVNGAASFTEKKRGGYGPTFSNNTRYCIGTFWEPNTNTHRETGHTPTRIGAGSALGGLVSTAQSTTRNHEGLHAGSTEGGPRSKNVHVSRALCIFSTRVFLTREASEWECLTAGAPSTQAAGMQARRAWVKKPPGPC